MTLIIFSILFAFFLPAGQGMPDNPPIPSATPSPTGIRPQRGEVSELLLPDLQTLPPKDLKLILDQESRRKWVRFSNRIGNSGAGVLELEAVENRETGTITVMQNLYLEDGSLETRQVGEFEFHTPHNHWHFDDFSVYEIWSIKLGGELDRPLASSGKIGYCVRDTDPHKDENSLESSDQQPPPSSPRYTGCGWSLQGLSVDWSDTYKYNIPGQSIDITHLPDGVYALKSTVDPDNLLHELNEDNNSAVIYFAVRNNGINVLEYLLRSQATPVIRVE